MNIEVRGPRGQPIALEANRVDVRVTARLNAVTVYVRDPVDRGCQATMIDGFQVVFTGRGVEVSWDAPGVAAITRYRIQLTDDGGITMSPTLSGARGIGHRWVDIPGSHAGTTSHLLTGLRMNHTYGVWIHAVDTRNDAAAANDRYYCLSRGAFITPFNVHMPAITGLDVFSTWDDGPEQATLFWDAHPRQEVWSATLTVDDSDDNSSFGCSSETPPPYMDGCDVGLTARTFSSGGVTRTQRPG